MCIKSGELELALDVYGQMRAEGVTPNLVTFNTLIDVYGKTGQWEEAVRVLDTLEQQVPSVWYHLPHLASAGLTWRVLLQLCLRADRDRSVRHNLCIATVAHQELLSELRSVDTCT